MPDSPQNPGCVYVIGAGPGDPELLTLKAHRLLCSAEAVVYDNLVSREILALAPPDAELIYAGKQRGNHALPQEELNLLLVKLAGKYQRVVRLKGGDPFIFGRCGEEVEVLAQHAIPFEIVPGITAANGVAAYAGIPLTHREYSQACVFVTGHLKDGSMDLDWAALARPRQTVVIYMGLLGLEKVCTQMMAHGLPEDWPAAMVQQGTTSKQRTVVGTLANLPQLAKASGLKAPTLIIIGRVVSLHQRLAWREELPPG